MSVRCIIGGLHGKDPGGSAAHCRRARHPNDISLDKNPDGQFDYGTKLFIRMQLAPPVLWPLSRAHEDRARPIKRASISRIQDAKMDEMLAHISECRSVST